MFNKNVCAKHLFKATLDKTQSKEAASAPPRICINKFHPKVQYIAEMSRLIHSIHAISIKQTYLCPQKTTRRDPFLLSELNYS